MKVSNYWLSLPMNLLNMMQAIILKCPPNARFHFGKTGLDENASLFQTSEILHSDTLFSALINTCNKVAKDEINPLIAAFKKDENGLKISSGYYCLEVIEAGKTPRFIYFLPKPNYFNLVNKDTTQRKAVKKVAFISKTVWEKGLLPHEWIESKGCYTIDEKFIIHTEDLSPSFIRPVKKIYRTTTNPKIADHARQKRNNIFFQTDLKLSRINSKGLTIQPHFYFLLANRLPAEQQRLAKLFFFLLEILMDEGIGGAISTGCGQLLGYESKPLNLDIPEAHLSTDYFTNMSLLAPDVSNDLSHIYNGGIITRGGRKTAAAGRLSRIKMFKEGAIIGKEVTGKIPNLHNTQPFLRYGKTFPIPMHQKYVLNDYL